jgi:thiol-disulfide isomerase/thioredoxin
MKRKFFIALFMLTGIIQAAFARNGYKIQLKFTDIKDSTIYLAYYYAKPLPNAIYKVDSAKIDHNGTVTFQSKDSIIGGIYLFLLSDHKSYFEFLMDNGIDISITANMNSLQNGELKFKNSPENDRFMEYVRFLRDYGAKQQGLVNAFMNAKTTEDTANARKAIREHSEKLIKYREDYVKKYPHTLLANIFDAIEVPEVPDGVHYTADHKVDSDYDYNYYKEHYWDHFNFRDDRLIHAPIYDGKLNEYFGKLVLPYPDSVEAESDKLLAKTRGTKELFKYTLWWLEHYAQDSKIMGMDAVEVYLIENYYMKGDATWLSNEDLEKYIDHASKIAPNVIGNLAPEINLPDANGKEQSLLGLKAKYTLLIFWAPDCGHCQNELPKVDSVYEAVLKSRGVKVYAVKEGGTEEQWKDFIKKNHMEEWTNVHDPEKKHQDYRSKYDVYSTPIMYLLDEKKKIIGKRLDHANIMDVIEMTERKNKTTKE